MLTPTVQILMVYNPTTINPNLLNTNQTKVSIPLRTTEDIRNSYGAMQGMLRFLRGDSHTRGNIFKFSVQRLQK